MRFFRLGKGWEGVRCSIPRPPPTPRGKLRKKRKAGFLPFPPFAKCSKTARTYCGEGKLWPPAFSHSKALPFQRGSSVPHLLKERSNKQKGSISANILFPPLFAEQCEANVGECLMNNRFHSKEGENGGGVRTEGRAENFLPQGGD